MSEQGPFTITPEDIGRAKNLTGIYPQAEIKDFIGPLQPADFNSQLERFLVEQPELSLYLLGTMEKLYMSNFFSQVSDYYQQREQRESGLTVFPRPPKAPLDHGLPDPFMAGAIFTYFAIPEDVRSRLTSTQAVSVERAVEEGRSGGDVPDSLVVVLENNLEVGDEFIKVIEQLADDQPSDQHAFEFLAGSFTVISPFVSRENTAKLEGLWGFQPEE